MAVARGASKEVTIPALELMRTTIRVEGQKPLIVHAWSKKAQEEILSKQTGKARQRKAPKIPAKDFVESLHIAEGTLPEIDYENQSDEQIIEALKGAIHGFPVIGFKAAAVTAWDQVGGIKKKQIQAAFHINSPYRNSNGDEIAQLNYGKLEKRQDMVRIQGSTADIRFRGEYHDWNCELDIIYNQSVVSLEQLVHILNTAGFGVGVGEWRPQKNGQNGLFTVSGASPVEQHNPVDVVVG